MKFYVYILLCKDGSYYTGYTRDLKKRIELHEKGKGARYTRIHKPERVVYAEPFDSQSKAMKYERAIKKLSHLQKLNLINDQNTSK